ncbi:MAG: Mut7-C RNAse domain-containing protein [Bacillota bacterium]|nr:Mut7-C RNAse domain-containing protein [Bacillota bacterium]
MPSTAYFRFYAELNDFLPPERKQVKFAYSFFGQPTVKDLIESLGVPHTEVDLVLINGESVGFTRQVEEGDLVSVYPVFEGFDISPVIKVRPEPLRVHRFILDTHLGKLASYLRMLGFDVLYQNDYADEVLAHISADERRILLTRDRGLLKRSKVTHGYLVRADNPRDQLLEVLRRFDLFNSVYPFQRCMRCNELLEQASLEDVKESVPPGIQNKTDQYRRCPGCGRVYWKGSHYDKMVDFINCLDKD